MKFSQEDSGDRRVKPSPAGLLVAPEKDVDEIEILAVESQKIFYCDPNAISA